MQYLMGCDDGGKLRLIDKDYHSPFRGKPSLRFAPVQVRRILLTELPSQLVQPLIRALDRVMRIGVGNRGGLKGSMQHWLAVYPPISF